MKHLPAASCRLPVRFTGNWRLATGNCIFRIAIPVHPISGRRGDEFEHKKQSFKVSRFQSFKVSSGVAGFETLKL